MIIQAGGTITESFVTLIDDVLVLFGVIKSALLELQILTVLAIVPAVVAFAMYVNVRFLPLLMVSTFMVILSPAVITPVPET